MYIIPDYTRTVGSLTMEFDDTLIDCFTEKVPEQKDETPKIDKKLETFKSDSMESYHKEDIIKINQQKLITHVNTQSKIIDYYQTKLKKSTK